MKQCVILSVAKDLAVLSLAAAMFVACDSSSTEPDDEDSSSSVAEKGASSSGKASSSSSVKATSSSAKSSSSTSKYVCDIYDLADALSCDCDESREDSLAYNYDSDVELVCIYDEYLNKWGWVKKAESSSSSVLSSSSSKDPEPAEGSSSSSLSSSATTEDLASSSSSRVILSSSEESSASSSSTAKSSSSSVKMSSSSSEYVPFDHSVTLAGVFEVGKDAYKQFTDERNGRSYYYITIAGKDTSGKDNSVTVMAENLNVGDFVWGFLDQEDDSKIERYCYNDDTTKCDRYGGLYQWAEAMALPSECNAKSCADQIKENHQGICPTGWRLLTYNDFYTILHANTNDDGVKGLRSSYQFSGSNYSGYSLLGGGMRTSKDKSFTSLGLSEIWFYPEEFVAGEARVTDISSSNYLPGDYETGYKTDGFSVRCVKMEE